MLEAFRLLPRLNVELGTSRGGEESRIKDCTFSTKLYAFSLTVDL
jgi:hypothetical protein